MKRLWWHGTTTECARVILREGFRKGTYYAAQLEDALKFGGPHVFTVAFSVNRRAGAVKLYDPGLRIWQVCLDNKLPPEAIVGYRIYHVEQKFYNAEKIDKRFNGWQDGEMACCEQTAIRNGPTGR